MKILASASAAALVVAFAGSASAQSIPYQGGPVLHHARVRLVLAGAEWANDPSGVARTVGLVRDVANRSQFYGVLAEYYDAAGAVGEGSFDEHYEIDARDLPRVGGGACDLTYCVDNGEAEAVLTDDVGRWQDHGADDVYLVVFPSDASIFAPDPQTVIGGKHNEVDLPGLRVPYAFVTVEHSITHELGEAITDPFPKTQPAWTTKNGTEIGDPCNQAVGRLDNADMGLIASNAAGRCVPWPTWPALGGDVTSSEDRIFTGDAEFGPSDEYLLALPRSDAQGMLGVFTVTSAHHVDYDNFEGRFGWLGFEEPRDPGWVSHIAALSTPTRATDLFGIGGDGRIYWKKSADHDVRYEGWALVSGFTAQEVAIAPGGFGEATVFAIDANGVVHWQSLAGTAAPTTSGWGTFDAIPSGEFPHLSAVSANGRLYVAASGNRGWPIYLMREDVFFIPGYGGNGMHWWESWQTLPAPSGAAGAIDQVLLARSPAASPGGERPVVLAVSGAMAWRTFDDASDPTAIASRWQTMPFHDPVGKVTAANNDVNGRLEVFALGPASVTQEGRVEHVWQTASMRDDDWAGPASRGGAAYAITSAVWPAPDGRIELFMVDRGQVVHDWQIRQPDGSITWAY